MSGSCPSGGPTIRVLREVRLPRRRPSAGGRSARRLRPAEAIAASLSFGLPLCVSVRRCVFASGSSTPAAGRRPSPASGRSPCRSSRAVAEADRERQLALAQVAAAAGHLPAVASARRPRPSPAPRSPSGSTSCRRPPARAGPSCSRGSLSLRSSRAGPPLATSTTSRSPSPSKSRNARPAADQRLRTGPARPSRRSTGSNRRCCVAGVPEQLRRLGVLLARLDLGDLRLDVAVARQQVEPAVEVVVEEERAELQRRPARPGQPDRQGRVGEQQRRVRGPGAQERDRLVGEVGDDDGELARQVLAPVDAHAAAGLALVGVGGADRSALLLEHAACRPGRRRCGRRSSAPCRWRRAGPASRRRPGRRRSRRATWPPAAARAFGAGALLLGDDHARPSRTRPRTACRRRCGTAHWPPSKSLRLARTPGRRRVRLTLDVQVDGRRPGDVVADEQVEPAVAVVVEERGRRAERDRLLPLEELVARAVSASARRRRRRRRRSRPRTSCPSVVAEQAVLADAR